jgi:hypothetical protein
MLSWQIPFSYLPKSVYRKYAAESITQVVGQVKANGAEHTSSPKCDMEILNPHIKFSCHFEEGPIIGLDGISFIFGAGKVCIK